MRNKIIQIYGPKGTEDMVASFFEAYERDIWYRLQETEFTHEKLMDIREMIKVHDVGPGLICMNSKWRVYAENVDHGHGLGLRRKDWGSLAYRVESKGKSIVITGDAVRSQSLIELAYGVDALVMCCYLSGEEILDHDTELISRYVLNSSIDAGKIATEASVKRIILVHIREKSSRALDAMVEEIKNDYKGEIIIGEDLLDIQIYECT